jgi:anthranilate 1,2-dioxygenase ferredoxin component
MSESWHPLIADSELAVDGLHAMLANGWHVLIARNADGLFAMNDRCTHQASRLSTGRMRRGSIMCPLHGARFDMASGKCLGGAYRDLRTFPVRITDGMIEVALPDAAPRLEDLPVGL